MPPRRNPRRTQPSSEEHEQIQFGDVRDQDLARLAAWITSGCGAAEWEALKAAGRRSDAPAWLCPAELGLERDDDHRMLCCCLAWAVLPRPGEALPQGRALEVSEVVQALGLTGTADLCRLYEQFQGGSPLDAYLQISREGQNMSAADFMGADLEIPLRALRRLLEPCTGETEESPVGGLADLCLPLEVRRKAEALLAAPPAPDAPFWVALTGAEGSGRRSLGVCLAKALGRELVYPPHRPGPNSILALTQEADGSWSGHPQRQLRNEGWVFLCAESPNDPFAALADVVLDLGTPDLEARKAYVTQVAQKEGLSASPEVIHAMLERFPLAPGNLRQAVELAGRKARSRGGKPEEHARFLEQGLSALANRPASGPQRRFPGRDGLDPKDAIEKVKPRLRRSDLVLAPGLGESLDRGLRAIRNRGTLMKDWGLDERILPTSKGVFLFHGPSGTGKSMAAEVMAGELGVELWRVQAANLQSPYVGESEQRISGLFKIFKGSSAVILLDEVDNFLGDRAKDLSTAKVHNQGVVNAFLRELDTFDGILVFTTNLAEQLDPAVERRIQTRLVFPLPGEAERHQIWRQLWKDTIPTDGTVDLGEIARRFDLSGGLIRNAFLAACQRGAEQSRMTQEILLDTCREEQENRLKRDAQRRIKGFAA